MVELIETVLADCVVEFAEKDGSACFFVVGFVAKTASFFYFFASHLLYISINNISTSYARAYDYIKLTAKTVNKS